MLRRLRYLGIALVVAAVVSGCEAPLPDTPPQTIAPSASLPTPAEAFSRWEAIADQEPAHRDVEQAFAMTGAMAVEEGGLAELIKFAGNEAHSGEKRVFAVMCLSTQRDALASYEPTVKEWIGESHPLETRKLATHVLGLMKSSSATEALEKQLADTARPVREAAVGVALTYHPELITGQLTDFWNDPETTPAIRNQVVLGMPSHLVGSYLPIYAEAATDTRLAEPARLRAISVLGELGDATHQSVLAACIDGSPEGTIRAHAEGALALLKASTGQEPATATE